MKKFFCILGLIGLFSVFMVTVLIAQDTNRDTEQEEDLTGGLINQYLTYNQDGNKYYEDGDYRKAIKFYRKAIELFDKNPVPYYNSACSAALFGWEKTAFKYLAQATERGFLELEHMEKDPDLDSLRDDKRYEQIMEKAQSLLEERRNAIKQFQPPDIDLAEYETFDELERYLAEKQSDITRLREIRYFPNYITELRTFWWEKIQALNQYIDKNPENKDIEKVYRVLLTFGYSILPDGFNYKKLLDNLLERADEYLEKFPNGKEVASARYYKIRCQFLENLPAARDESDGSSEIMENIDSALNNLIRDLFTLALEFDGSESAGFALVDLAEIHATGDIKKDLPTARHLYKIIKNRYRENEQVQSYFTETFGMNIIMLAGMFPFHAMDLDGNIVNLESLKGNITLIDFWATWCTPCVKELPTLKNLYEKYHSRGLEILGISLDISSQVTLENFKKWLKDNQMSWPQIYDGKGWNSDLAKLYKINKIPSTILLDRNGDVIDVDLRGEFLVDAIDTLFQ